jgi:hypothetical protein
MTTASEGMVRILTLRARYFVSADHPDVAGLRDRLDVAAHKALPQALGPMFARAAPDDDALWFVRRLSLDLDLDASADVDDMGRHWARGLTSALLAELTGEGGGNVVRFADRTEYLGRFLVDLASETAWGRWYYEGFAGLRALPASAAIRTALLDEPGIGLDALLRMSGKNAAVVAAELGDRDAERVLAAWAAEGPGSAEDESLAALLDACTPMDTAAAGLTDSRSELLLYVTTRRRHPVVGGAALAQAAGAATSLLQLRARGAALHAVLDALRRSDAGALAGLAGGEAARLLPLARASPDLLARMVRACDPPPVAVAGPGETRHGGVFLLLPLLAELPIEEAAER